MHQVLLQEMSTLSVGTLLNYASGSGSMGNCLLAVYTRLKAVSWHCRFLRVIIVSSFREEAQGQKQVVGVQHDLAVLFAEASQNIAGAPSNVHLADLFKAAAPRKMKTNIWARLRGQQEQITIQVAVLDADC